MTAPSSWMDDMASASLAALASKGEDVTIRTLDREHRVEWGAQRGDWAPEPGSVIRAFDEDEARHMAQRFGDDGMEFTVVSREVTVLTSPWVPAEEVDHG